MGNQSAPKSKLRKGLWSPEEDEKLVRHITKYGHKCWSIVPKQAGLQRCGKSCRLRWINYLRPDLKRGHFTQEEEELIIKLHAVLGNRWAQIATQLPGRTDNEIKNFWNSCLRKKLRQIGIDPQTHKPLAELSPLRVGNVVDGGEVLQQDDKPLKLLQQHLMVDRAAEASDNNNFTMSMLPITYNPMSNKNCHVEDSSKHPSDTWASRTGCCCKAHPMLDDSAGGFHFHLMDGFGSTFSNENSSSMNGSPSSGFSPCLQLDEQQTSSGETGSSEIINSFPFWEACSNSGIKAVSEGTSWGFAEGMFYPYSKWGLCSDTMLESKMESSEAIGWQLNQTALYDDCEASVSDPLSSDSISAVLDQM